MSVSGRIPGEQSANDWIRDATGANAAKKSGSCDLAFFISGGLGGEPVRSSSQIQFNPLARTRSKRDQHVEAEFVPLAAH
jgi:hypothetical protein